MDGAADGEAVPTPSNQSIPSMRKKMRKGTRSCWECKRRKIRCIFASPQAETCIGCERRRTPCVNQDLPENLAPATVGNRHLSARIARVEDVMRDLLAGDRVGATRRFHGEPQRDVQPPQLNTQGVGSNESTDQASPTHQLPVEVSVENQPQ